ncbi:MAG: hypothetical protein IAF38_22775 [Bacteroidia bacterium]|nr:hypothetical protein [Bacteroidia bacterium]
MKKKGSISLLTLIAFLLLSCNGNSQFPYKEIPGDAGDMVFLKVGDKKITKEQVNPKS